MPRNRLLRNTKSSPSVRTTMSDSSEQQSSSSGQPKRQRKKYVKHNRQRAMKIGEYSISHEMYTKTLAMLNSDSNIYDHTPLTTSKNPKNHPSRKEFVLSKQNCEKRIRIFEGYVPSDGDRLDLYQLNAPNRIFNAMHVCLQSEDWKTMCELVLAAIRSTLTAPLMKYRLMFLQLAMIAILHDPFARFELTEIYLTGVLNCKSLEDIDVFMQSLCQNRMTHAVRNELETDTNSDWETDDE